MYIKFIIERVGNVHTDVLSSKPYALRTNAFACVHRYSSSQERIADAMSASLLTVTLRVPNAMKSSMDYRHYFVALSCPYLIDSIQIQSPNYRSVGLFIVSISNKSLRSSAFSARGTTMEQL
jgi:hypothetical protein